jgi:hypothetical protein
MATSEYLRQVGSVLRIGVTVASYRTKTPMRTFPARFIEDHRIQQFCAAGAR